MTLRRRSSEGTGPDGAAHAHRSRPVWYDDAPDGAPFAATLPIATDVVVIGAGLAGLWIAHHLADAGRRVVVLEAERVASGTTGASTAKVSALHGRTYAQLERQRGAEVARGYAEANLAAVEQYERLVDELGLDCGWERTVASTYTVDPARRGDVEAEAEAAARAGMVVRLETDLGLPFEVAAAVVADAQAQVHPRRFALGLARSLRDRGVAIAERTPVVAIEAGPPHQVLLGDGREVVAPVVVQATHLPIHDPGMLFAQVAPTRSYALAATLREPVPGGAHLSIDQPSRSIRPLVHGSTVGIFGGGGHRVGEGGDTRSQWDDLEAWVREHFPVVSVDARWSAQDHVPIDQVPYLGRLPRGAEGLYVATGFKKWGFTTAAVAGELIAALVRGEDHQWLEVFDASRRPSSGRAVVEAAKGNVEVGVHLVGDRLHDAVDRDHLDDVAPGEGAICHHDGEVVAAHRDEEGLLHVVSATCTHLGCRVRWNAAEASWDCPCHGSRFDVEGRILEGPAVLGLRRVDVPMAGAGTDDG